MVEGGDKVVPIGIASLIDDGIQPQPARRSKLIRAARKAWKPVEKKPVSDFNLDSQYPPEMPVLISGDGALQGENFQPQGLHSIPAGRSIR